MLLYHEGLNPLVLLLAALALDFLLGDMPMLFRFVPHPVVLVGRAVTFLDRRLNRERRGERARLVRGVFAVALLVVAAAAAGAALAVVLRVVRFGWAVEALIVAVLLVRRPPAALRRAFAGVAVLRPALIGWLVMSVVGAVLNDSGVVIPALAVLVVLPATMTVTLASARCDEPVTESTQPPPSLLR